MIPASGHHTHLEFWILGRVPDRELCRDDRVSQSRARACAMLIPTLAVLAFVWKSAHATCADNNFHIWRLQIFA
jgi:hypothetical protein